MSKVNYDDEEVFYCGTCLSLKILNSSNTGEDMEDDLLPCYCGDCSSTDIEQALIGNVLELRKERKNKR